MSIFSFTFPGASSGEMGEMSKFAASSASHSPVTSLQKSLQAPKCHCFRASITSELCSVICLNQSLWVSFSSLGLNIITDSCASLWF